MNAKQRNNGIKVKNCSWKLVVPIAVAVLCCFAVAITFFFVKADYTVARVNGVSVTKSELLLQAEANEGMVKAELLAENGITAAEFSWNAVYNGKKAKTLLLERSLDSMLRGKVIRIQCERQGVIQDASYKAFLKEYNQYRKSQSVGATPDTAKTFYDMQTANYTAKLEAHMQRNVFNVGESEGREYWRQCYDASDDKDNFAPYESDPTNWINGAAKIIFDKWLLERINEASAQLTALSRLIKI